MSGRDYRTEILCRWRIAIARFRESRRAATAIEYGLIVACIFVVIVVAVTFAGQEVSDDFNMIANNMDASIN